METAGISGMQKAVQQLLDLFGPYVESNSRVSWKPADGYLPVIFKAILMRHFETLQVISQMVADGNSSAAGPLLRPACEEFIWAKYLLQIPPDKAQQLVACIALDERYKSLRAQDRYAGRRVTEELGLLPYLEQSNSMRKDLLNLLRDVGKQLDWPERVVSDGSLPRVDWLAGAVEEQSTYKFIYHATSRYVHFSVHNLLRRAWGTPANESLSIDSGNLSDYWAHCFLHWGTLLFIRTYDVLAGGGTLDETEMTRSVSDRALEIAEEIGSYGEALIIMADELYWPRE